MTVTADPQSTPAMNGWAAPAEGWVVGPDRPRLGIRLRGLPGCHRPGTATQRRAHPDDHRHPCPPNRRTLSRAAPRPSGRTPGRPRRRRPRADHVAGWRRYLRAMATLRTYSTGNSHIFKPRELLLHTPDRRCGHANTVCRTCGRARWTMTRERCCLLYTSPSPRDGL